MTSTTFADAAAAYEEQMAAVLRSTITEMPGLTASDLEFPTDPWGIRVKATSRAWIYVKKMLFANWRIIEVIPEDLPPDNPFYPASTCERSWCYGALAEAVARAAAWDGQADTEPSGWLKEAGTERRHGEPTPGITQQ